MRPRSSLRLALLGATALVLLVAGCGDDDADDSADTTSTTGQEHGCAVAEGGEVTIVAQDLAWDVPCIQAPEGLALTITVDNQDDGVNHNLHVTGLPRSPTTPLQAGPVRQELDLTADELPAGEYAYVCDVHPDMTGTLEALAPLAEGAVTPRIPTARP